MKKCNLKTFRVCGKTMTMKMTADNIVLELEEHRNLFARLLLISKTRKEVNLQKVIGQYELSVVPRPMFAVDGSMLHCQLKSSLLHIMENYPKVTKRVQMRSGVEVAAALLHMSTTQLPLLMRWLNYSHLTNPIAYRTADTKILLHAVDATSRGVSGISVHSPDTDVLVLVVRRYPLLCPSTTFVTGTGQKVAIFH